MARELPRTVFSLSPPYQNGVDASDVEIIVVDNGSDRPADISELTQQACAVRVLNVPHPNKSPARAANFGVAQARGDIIGLWIDGARLASPGILRGVLDSQRLRPAAGILTLGLHLGPGPQQESMLNGYDQRAEDRLLETIDWREDGYRLFQIASLARSSSEGWFSELAESNGIFMHRELWHELSGLDEAFTLPGGGLVNLDLLQRMLAASPVDPVTLLGEGTFHQIHGGVSTNARVSPWPEFAREYREIRGRDFEPVSYSSRFYSCVDRHRLLDIFRAFQPV